MLFVDADSHIPVIRRPPWEGIREVAFRRYLRNRLQKYYAACVQGVGSYGDLGLAYFILTLHCLLLQIHFRELPILNLIEDLAIISEWFRRQEDLRSAIFEEPEFPVSPVFRVRLKKIKSLVMAEENFETKKNILLKEGCNLGLGIVEK